MPNKLLQGNPGLSFLMLKLSIWSVSILTSITGLAISPGLPDIQKTFPRVSETSIDMLISLPNLFLIPFVIIAGKLAQKKSSVMLIRIGCLVFILSAVAYQFANSIFYLLLVSIILGIGAGFVVPLAAQLPSVIFQGTERQKQMGICSGISNATQVFCTFLAGWLATMNWHTAFWVYSIAVIPLLLSPFLKISSSNNSSPGVTQESADEAEIIGKGGIDRKGLIKLMALYFIVMFFNLQIPLNLPFLLESHHIDTTISGSLVAIFFMVQALTAFVINRIIRLFKKYTMAFVLFVITLCLLLFPLVQGTGWYYLLAAAAGITGGTIEPLIWNKTSNVTSRKQSSLAFGWIMSACYLSIWATPYIVDVFAKLLHDDRHNFPFFIAGALSLLFTLFLFLSRNEAIFGMKNEVAEMKQPPAKK